MQELIGARGVYFFECRDNAGNLKWAETVNNLITTQGKNAFLDCYLGSGTAPSAFYMSLITAGTPAAGNTYASPSVTEITSGIISSNTRPTVGWSSASSGSKSATSTSFSITGTATITGNMLVSGGTGASTVANTSATGGVLFSAATFSSSKSVSNGDTLSVTYSVSI